MPRWFSELALVLTLAVTLLAEGAEAHAILISSTPAINAAVPGPEVEFTLRFNSRIIAVCPGRGGVEICTILDTLADPTHGHVQPIEAGGVLPAVPPTRKRQNGTSGTDGQKQGRALRSPQS